MNGFEQYYICLPKGSLNKEARNLRGDLNDGKRHLGRRWGGGGGRDMILKKKEVDSFSES